VRRRFAGLTALSALALLAPVALLACGSAALAPTSPRSPPIERALRDVLLEPPGDPSRRLLAIDTARAVIRSVEDEEAETTGLLAPLEMLAIGCETSREERCARLEALADGEYGADTLSRRLAAGALERDPRWLAARLEGDALYSDFAAFWNGVLRTAFSALQGNPIGVLQPLVVGIEGVVRGQPLDPRDRKRLTLERRLRAEGEPAVLDPRTRERVAALHDQSCREALRLARMALERRDPVAAAIHLDGARAFLRREDEVAEIAVEIDAQLAARREALAAALAVEPVEIDLDGFDRTRVSALVAAWLARDAAALAAAQRDLEAEPPTHHAEHYAAALASANALRRASRLGPPGAADLRAVARRFADTEHAPLAARASTRLDARDLAPFHAAGDVAQQTRRATWRFVFTGERISGDPLEAHADARRAETRSWIDALAPIFWLPATLIRGAYAALGEPIDDRRRIDALAAAVRATRSAPGAAHDLARREALAELAERHERRGEYWKARLALLEARADRDSIEELEAKLADEILAEGDSDRGGGGDRLREARLRWLIGALPDTEHAARARQALATIAASPRGEPIALRFALAVAPELPIDPGWQDGDERNGEIDPERIELLEHGIAFALREGSQTRRVSIDVASETHERLLAAAAEQRWRYAVARAATYHELHSGIPVELYAGLGVSGASAYPRLVEEGYDLADRRYYE
jgi:hypothetical protein